MAQLRRRRAWLGLLLLASNNTHATIPQHRVKPTTRPLKYNRPLKHSKFYLPETQEQQQEQQRQQRSLLQHHKDWGWMVDTINTRKLTTTTTEFSNKNTTTTTTEFSNKNTTTQLEEEEFPQDELPGEANGYNLTTEVEYNNSTNSTENSTSVVTSSTPSNNNNNNNETTTSISTAYQPIRIRAILSQDGEFLKEHERLTLLEQILSPAMLAWSSALRVIPVLGNLTIDPNQLHDNRTCGGVVEIPPTHFVEGIPETDLILYLSLGFVLPDEAQFQEESLPRLPGLVGDRGENSPHLAWWSHLPPCLDPSAVASAAYCATDQYDRPTAAMLHLCIDPDFFFSRINRHVVTVMHEIGHALGFNAQSFAYFRHADGTPMTPRDETTGDVLDVEVNCTGPSPNEQNNRTEFVPLPSSNVLQFRNVRGGVRVAEIVTPSVRQVARNHFDCPSLSGAELESSDENCIGNHWERRVLRTDLMSALVDEVPYSFRISPMTLALFADSGWYQVDLERAQFSSGWGRRAGCEFVNEPCISENEKVSLDNRPFFCSKGVSAQQRGTLLELNGCSADLQRKAVCSLTMHEEDLPVPFQYFEENARIGGTEPLMDYCPVYTGFANGLCKIAENQEFLRVHEAEEFGVKNSRCVTGIVNDDTLALCLPIACVMKDRSLRIKTGRRTWQKCHFARQQLSLDNSDDTVICPDPRRVCPTFYCRRDCLGTNGVCDYATGECLCNVTNITGTTLGPCGDIYSEDQVAAQLFHDEVADSASPLLSDYYYASPENFTNQRSGMSRVVKIIVVSLGSLVGACVVFLLWRYRQKVVFTPVRRLSARIRQGLMNNADADGDRQDDDDNDDMDNKAFANKDIMIASMLVDMRIHHPQLELEDAPPDFFKDTEASSVQAVSVTESEESSQLDKTSEIESVGHQIESEAGVESSLVAVDHSDVELRMKRATATLVRRRRKT